MQVVNKIEVDKKYSYWRMRIFYSMFFGYVFFYFTRKNFTTVMSFMQKDLCYTTEQIGMISTVFYLLYGASKFASGVLSDRSNPRYLMAAGLILTGIFNICFGFSSSLWVLCVFWGLNGIFQGWGWLPITKLLTYWYAKKERGTWWSFCATSHNVGGALIPILAMYLAIKFNLGWRGAMYVPGIMCIFAGLFLLNRLRDVPESLGLPSIEVYKGSDTAVSKNHSQEVEQNLSIKKILLYNVLNNKYVWLLSISSFFVYIVRTAINDWTILFLIDIKNYPEVLAASGIAWFEIGGFVGMLAAGWGSDFFFKGNRIPYMISCVLGLTAAIYYFWHLSIGSYYIDFALLAVIGFLVFGPQMLVGLAAVEYVDKKAACTAHGFAGLLAYIGAAVAGAPLGRLIDSSWDDYFMTLIFCSLVVFVILLPISVKKKVSVILPNSVENEAT
jgi:OPA family sugar phosphate sensor protein UhpC-like MFS transporter